MKPGGTALNERMETTTDRMPAVYLGHGAPPLVYDEVWVAQLQRWAADLPKPKSILVVSAHWESAPLTLGATRDAAPLTYDFYGFPQRFYDMTYPAPGAHQTSARPGVSPPRRWRRTSSTRR